MYFGVGLPRTLASGLGSNADGDEWIFLEQDQHYMVAVSARTVQLWSVGLHRVRLSVVECASGNNIDAYWCSVKATLATLTDQGTLDIYHLHTSTEPAVTVRTSALRGPCKTAIYLRHSVQVASLSMPTCLSGDFKFVFVGCKDGSINIINWAGKERDVLGPAPHPAADASTTPTTSPFHSLTRMHVCERSRLMAVVMSTGVCALLSVGPQHPSYLEFKQWVCFANATCARVGAAAQLVAVGGMNGVVSLYKLQALEVNGAGGSAGEWVPQHSGDVAVRNLGLEPWGHPPHQTGPVQQVEWSPDGRVLAVGYQYSGVAVWTPSGCRLFCSLRQSPERSVFTPHLSMDPQHARLQPRLSTLSHRPSIGDQGPGQLASRDAPITLSSEASLPGTTGPVGAPSPGCLEGGVSVLSWGPGGYCLTVGPQGPTHSLEEMSFVQSLPGHHRVAHAVSVGGLMSEELIVLQGADRLLMVEPARNSVGVRTLASQSAGMNGGGAGASESGLGSELLVSHVLIPHQYLSCSWPVCHVAVSANGSDLAVGGPSGLALYNRKLDRWRLFGDVSQERRVCARALGWVGDAVLVASSPPGSGLSRAGSVSKLGSGTATGTGTGSGTGAHQLLMFPKHHLDFSSLLSSFPLAQAPTAMDVAGNHVLLAFEGLDIALLEVSQSGELKAGGGSPAATLTVLRDISVVDIGRPLIGATLVTYKPYPHHTSGHLVQPPPTRCVLHRWGGLLSVLDLERGSETLLGTDIETYWVCDTHAPETSKDPGNGNGMGPAGEEDSAERHSGPREVDMPWWGYGPQGTQLWFPSQVLATHHQQHTGSQLSSPGHPTPTSSTQLPPWGPRWTRLGGVNQQDLELEFDTEVYPVGISLADASVVGMTQRLIRNQLRHLSAVNPPVFYALPESQPVLPCLLRRLLAADSLHDARVLALRHSGSAHFSRSLEWLLFTALEANAEMAEDENTTHPQSILSRAAALLRSFPAVFGECVVAVARKTDISLWASLFAAVGSPGAVLEGLMERGSLVAAANMLIVVDSMQGASAAYTKAVKLLQVSLARAQYGLSGELLRYILFPNENEVVEAGPDGDKPPAAHAATTPTQRNSGAMQAEHELPRTPSTATATSRPGRTWFGWLFGYGGAHEDGPARSSSRSDAPGTMALALQNTRPAPAGTTTTSTTTHMAVHAAAAREAVADHAQSLLQGGRLLQLQECAAALAFLPGGLPGLVTHHAHSHSLHRASVASNPAADPSPTPLTPGHTPITAVELLSSLSLATQQLPVWLGPAVEQEARGVMALVAALGAHVWVLALSILVVDISVVREYALANPEEWTTFVSVVQTDSTFAYLHPVINALVLDAPVTPTAQRQQ